MKKKLLSLILGVSLIFGLCSCAMMDASGGMNNMGSAGAPNYGMAVDDNVSSESYTEIVENGFVTTTEKPSSYFSIDANTASYPNLRRYITNGYYVQNINRDMVRVEEMLNYFD